MQIGKICQQLWPLIDVQIAFSLSVLSIFDRLSSTFVKELMLGRSGLGLQMGNITELWPLIDVQIAYSLSVLSIFDRFSSTFVKELILGGSSLGLQMGSFCQIRTIKMSFSDNSFVKLSRTYNRLHSLWIPNIMLQRDCTVYF